MKVAIVHDWLVGGGAERVVLELHHIYPDAPIYTSYCSDEWRAKLDGKVVTGFLQKWPFSRMRKFLPVLRIWWFTRLDPSGYDLVISSSGNGEAKGVRTSGKTRHICYCHAPTHFYWRHYDQYLKQPGFGVFNPLARLGLRALVGPLRRWDLKASKRPDVMIANSTHTKQEIKTYYGREAIVIHPPVNTAAFSAGGQPKRHGFVMAGRQTAYKRFDLAVQACSLLGLPLTIVGDGPEFAKLKAMSGPTTTFTGWVPFGEVVSYVQSAEAFIFPSLEDFGIAPVEALAAGTPVIAFRGGGALDYVEEGRSGILFDNQTVESLVSALKKFDSKNFNPVEVQASAQKFNEKRFVVQLKKTIQAAIS